MSAIYGQINWDGKPICEESRASYRHNLQHRGENMPQEYSDEGILLAFFMSRTFKNDELCQQPYVYKNFVIIADVRLDNRSEIAKELDLATEELHISQDARIILKAYEKWGSSCTEHLLGDFAFVIWDRHNRQLYAARDHLGMKALFYYQTKSTIIFASEIRAIVEHPIVEKKLNEDRMVNYLLGINMGPDIVAETFFKDVYQLHGGHYLVKDHHYSSKHKYWELNHKSELHYQHFNDYADHFKTILSESIRCRMETNFEVGIALSGGLDSSSIATLAARQLASKQKALYATSSVMPDNHFPEEDEREYIQAILEQEQNISIDYVFDRNKFEAYPGYNKALSKAYTPCYWAYFLDEAFYRSLKTQNTNVRIMMTGVWGDAAVSYSGGGVEAHLLRNWQWKTLLKYAKSWEPSWKVKRFFIQMISPLIPSNIKALIKGKRIRDLVPNTLSDEWLVHPNINQRINNYYMQDDPFDLYQSMASIFNSQYCSSTFPEMETRAAYKGITYVNPLIDIRLLEFMLSIPVVHLAPFGIKRGFIRYAMDGLLPPKIQWRESKGVFAPDFSRRIITHRSEIEKNLCDNRNELIQKYIDIEKLIKSLNKMELVCELYQRNQAEKINDYSVILGISASHFLKKFFE